MPEERELEASEHVTAEEVASTDGVAGGERNGEEMSIATLERAILVGARALLRNPKLRMKDVLEWRTGVIDPQAGEVVAFVTDPGVYVAVKVEQDKRARGGREG